MEQVKIVVVGAGASGLMAAVTAAQVQKKRKQPVSILLLESGAKPGRKLLATGNGRCNLTNVQLSVKNYHGDIDMAGDMLCRFPAEFTISRFEKMGLMCKEEDEGRVYPKNAQAAAVLSILMYHLEMLGVTVKCDFHVNSVKKEGKGFVVTSANGEEIYARQVIVATSGKAAPQFGSDGSGYDIAKSFGHTVTPCFPALVQVVCEADRIKSLKGMRSRGRVTLLADGQVMGVQDGEIQFTGYGLSGICVFQLSRIVSEWKCTGKVQGETFKEMELSLDLLPEMNMEELSSRLSQTVQALPKLPTSQILCGILNMRVGQEIMKEAVDGKKIELAEQITSDMIQKIAYLIKHCTFPVKDVQEWRNAQVTAGGIPLREIDCRYMESELCKNLYFCGEILNVDGDCGGYNLHWAWLTGALAGQSAALAGIRAGKTEVKQMEKAQKKQKRREGKVKKQQNKSCKKKKTSRAKKVSATKTAHHVYAEKIKGDTHASHF